jgi:type I restriction enzyme, S subunit
MEDNWRELPLSSLADLSGGFAFKSGDYAPEGRFILRTLNIRDDCSISRDDAVYLPKELCPQYARFELQSDDTLFVMVGATLGKIGFVRSKDLPALLNQNISAKRCVADPRFVHYAFRHAVKASLGWASGSARDFVRRDDYRNLRLRVPALAEQRAIANILGILEDKIELNRRMNETLEAIARALFKSWFVDFDPVCAKAEGRDPGLPKDIADLFPARLIDSDLGEIPEGWQVGSFAGEVEIIGGGTPTTSVDRYWNGDIPWFSVVDAPAASDVWVVDTEKKITLEGVKNSSARILQTGTTIISARGTVGRIALVGVPMAMNQSCYGLRSKAGRKGIFGYFVTRNLVSVIQQRAHGSVFDTITRDTLERVTVVAPPSQLVDAFESRVSAALERIRACALESRTLAAIRDALLPKLISGELRVKDVIDSLVQRSDGGSRV